MIEEAHPRGEARVTDPNEPSASILEPNSIDIFALLRKLRANGRTILTITFATFAFSVALAYLIPPRYTSRASFIPPNANNSAGASALAGQLAQLSGLGSASLLSGAKNSGDLYVGILKSRSIADELIKRFDLKKVYRVKRDSEAQKILAANSKFEVGTKDSVVSIGVTDKSPSRARDLASAYLDALRDTNGRLALTESSQRRLFFGQQLAREKDDLEDAEVALRKTEEQSGLIAPTSQTISEIQGIAQTRAEIAARQVRLSALRQSATDQNPDMVRLQSEISDLEGQLTRLLKGTGKSGNGAIPTSKVPELELDYVRKMREVKYHETLFEMISKQYEAARMDEAHDSPMLQVLDTASYPDTKSFPPRILFMVSGLFFGVLLGIGWTLTRDQVFSIRKSLGSVYDR